MILKGKSDVDFLVLNGVTDLGIVGKDFTLYSFGQG